MTSDAKIGLLLGLVFIFLIAFVINGLPRFSNDKNNNELTSNMVQVQNGPPAIAAKERKAINETARRAAARLETAQGQNAEQGVRYSRPLPKTTAAAKNGSVVKPDLLKEQKKKSGDVKSSRGEWPKVYVVQSGDNLAVIAKKFYGAEEGNRLKNIEWIYQANARNLVSPDEVSEGQKLFIPAPPGVGTQSIVSAGSSDERAEPVKLKQSSKKQKVRRGGFYVVKDGDSLWRIASEQLGDGTRYEEIAELNSKIIAEEDVLVVGMRLRLPAR